MCRGERFSSAQADRGSRRPEEQVHHESGTRKCTREWEKLRWVLAMEEGGQTELACV